MTAYKPKCLFLLKFIVAIQSLFLTDVKKPGDRENLVLIRDQSRRHRQALLHRSIHLQMTDGMLCCVRDTSSNP